MGNTSWAIILAGVMSRESWSAPFTNPCSDLSDDAPIGPKHTSVAKVVPMKNLFFQ